VLSTEKPNPTSVKMTDGANYKRSFYGTCSYIPCLFGEEKRKRALYITETVL
jgi:hypothetical protein